MSEVLFISESYLKQNSVISDNVDFKKMQNLVIEVQDIYLQPILGTSLFEHLKDAQLNNTLTIDENFLIKSYIQKIIVKYVEMESAMNLKFRFANKGVMVKSSENSQNADTKDLAMIMDRFRIKAEQYAELMAKYLCFNITKYPKYRDCVLWGLNARQNNYSTGIYLDATHEENNKEIKKIIISTT